MIRALSIFILLLLCGTAVAQVPPFPRFNLVTTTNAPQGTAVALQWNASPSANVQGYRVYWFNVNGPTNSVGLGNVTNAVIPNLFPPVWFYATAVSNTGEESAPSNLAMWLGWTTDVTIYVQTATNAAGPFGNDSVVQTRTNVTGTELFRLRAVATNRMVTVP